MKSRMRIFPDFTVRILIILIIVFVVAGYFAMKKTSVDSFGGGIASLITGDGNPYRLTRHVLTEEDYKHLEDQLVDGMDDLEPPAQWREPATLLAPFRVESSTDEAVDRLESLRKLIVERIGEDVKLEYAGCRGVRRSLFGVQYVTSLIVLLRHDDVLERVRLGVAVQVGSRWKLVSPDFRLLQEQVSY